MSFCPLEHEPELLALAERQLSFSEQLREGLELDTPLSTEGLTAQIMASLPAREPAQAQRPLAHAPVAQEARFSLGEWLKAHMSALLIGAATAAALLFAARLMTQGAPQGLSPHDTVMIKVDSPKTKGAAPVIWVLDEEEADEGADEVEGGAGTAEGEADDSI